MSLLLAHGHPDAWRYPIGRVFDEAQLVVERKNADLISLGVVVQSATATTGMTASQDAADAFRALIETLSGD